jgi:hypothetical protein
LSKSIGDIHEARGEAGLQELPGIGKSLGDQIARWLQEEADTTET